MSGADPAATGPRSPFFSVVVTSYNRSHIVRRCVRSCLHQIDESDFEVLVVDDGSSDDTVAALAAEFGDAVRVVVHARNLGINPARATGVREARGQWIVVVDSDWELVPETLARLRELIAAAPPGVRAVRSRLVWDDGHITPAVVPDGVIDYPGRIRWLEQLGETDAGRCFHRSLFDDAPYITGRRGAMETLWELRVARVALTVATDEVLGIEHATPDSWLRSAKRADLIPRLRTEAPDMLWMAETVLAEHGPALREHGPRQYAVAARIAAQNAFLSGRRGRGVRHTVRALRASPRDPISWVSLVLGVAHPAALAYGMLAYRRGV